MVEKLHGCRKINGHIKSRDCLLACFVSRQLGLHVLLAELSWSQPIRKTLGIRSTVSSLDKAQGFVLHTGRFQSSQLV